MEGINWGAVVLAFLTGPLVGTLYNGWRESRDRRNTESNAIAVKALDLEPDALRQMHDWWIEGYAESKTLLERATQAEAALKVAQHDVEFFKQQLAECEAELLKLRTP